MTTPEEAEFARQCEEAGEKINALLFTYPKPVAICVLPGVMAAVMKVFGVPREAVIAMLDSALKDIGDAK